MINDYYRLSLVVPQRRIAKINRLIGNGIKCCVAVATVKIEDDPDMYGKILENGDESLITNANYAYAMDSYYKPQVEAALDVVGEKNSKLGRKLIGETGEMGYHVPEADRVNNIKLEGNYIRKEWGSFARPGMVKMVCINKKYRVPRKMEEMICVKTGLNACSPLASREIRGTSRDSKLFDYPHRTDQFDIVAWESKKNEQNGSRLWRMGFVMNDLGPVVRILIPSGRMYILKTSRVVQFDFAGTLVDCVKKAIWDVGNEHFISSDNIKQFVDDDWEYEEDVKTFVDTRSRLSIEFVKDQVYPMRRLARIENEVNGISWRPPKVENEKNTLCKKRMKIENGMHPVSKRIKCV